MIYNDIFLGLIALIDKCFCQATHMWIVRNSNSGGKVLFLLSYNEKRYSSIINVIMAKGLATIAFEGSIVKLTVGFLPNG